MKFELVTKQLQNIRLLPSIAAFASIVAVSTEASTDSSVSGYVPLKQSPILESHINRVMIAAELGVVKRPISKNQLKKAYRKICVSSQVKNPAVRKGCIEVNKYLNKTANTFYINHASATLRYNNEKVQVVNQAPTTLNNQRGEHTDTSWSVQGQGIYNINNFALLSVGGKAWQGESNLEDTYVSFGIPQAQVDIGYKPHWLSPFKQSAMLLSTQAPTFANISVSNNTPMTSWNINYEIFSGELSTSNRIRYQGEFIAGKPMLTGLHVSMSPFNGFTLAVNRILQSGGGERNNDLGDLIKAFFDPSGADNTKEGLTADQEFRQSSSVHRFSFRLYWQRAFFCLYGIRR
ncbi:capsule assembly Wzi family protein [Psychrosphaera haliotis]|uniref:Uncharacterized protein n=1 Tax=Psychrosphaera haliotis TaxID=555083 RepID=A0A6N8F568_9GAMM|nr:hypothetical protein [Psychrosphaera haliotis]